MPTADVNSQLWDPQTDQWSAAWGGPAAQWYGMILPRIRTFLPAMTILEIAPGEGRWTRFLIPHCDRLHLANDSAELADIPDASIDFAFSFESLANAELGVLGDYAAMLATKLRPHGIAFLHHSALGMHQEALEIVSLIPEPMRSELVQPRWLLRNPTRADGVSPAEFAVLCKEAGLRAITQELVNWRGELLTDCFSTVTREGSRWERENRVVENRDFMHEAELIRSRASVYTYERAAPVALPRQAPLDLSHWD